MTPRRIPDHEWPCPWCGYVAPETHIRAQHLKTCPADPRPKERK